MQPQEKIPALFLHIQKTAGTSIVQMAANHYGNTNVCSHGDFLGRESQELAGVAFISGHFGYAFARPLMRGRYTFTFLRDPIERVLSFYSFCRSRNPDELPIYRVANELDLENFLRAAADNDLVRSRIWNSQVWRLATGPGSVPVDGMPPGEMLALAMAHLEEFDYIGFTESVDEDVVKIFQALQISNENLPAKVNVTEGRITANEISAECLALIEEMTQLDRRLYDAAWHARKRPGQLFSDADSKC